jgi:hypothetical protein
VMQRVLSDAFEFSVMQETCSFLVHVVHVVLS